MSRSRSPALRAQMALNSAWRRAEALRSEVIGPVGQKAADDLQRDIASATAALAEIRGLNLGQLAEIELAQRRNTP